MSQDDEKGKSTELFKQVLRGHIGGERKKIESSGLSPQMTLLKNWQVDRLKMTYDDMLHHPDNKAAAEFFLTDLYGAEDYSQRDTDAENVYNTMRKYLPDRLLVTMGKAIELNKMTQALDEQLLDTLVNQVGMTNHLTEQQYVEAYRLCDNQADRARQINMVLEVGYGVAGLTRIPMIGMVLRAARRPARRSGWSELHDFLDRGFNAFQQMDGAHPFLEAVGQREHQILNQIYSGAEQPFQID